MKVSFLNLNWHCFLLLPAFLAFMSCKNNADQNEDLKFTEDTISFTGHGEEKLAEHIKFSDITLSSGIKFKHVSGAVGKKWMPETIGSGAAFFDYDNDDWPDILLVNGDDWPGEKTGDGHHTPALYRNKGDGSFEDVTDLAGLDFSIYGMGAAIVDFDADGDPDIYLTAVGNNMLLVNDQGKYKDMAAPMGVLGNTPGSGRPAWSTSAVWLDVDGDGWLDLFVNNYVKWAPEADVYTTRDGKTKSYATPEVYEGESCRLYKNLGGKRFEDITESSGLLNHEGKSLGVAVADFNKDRWPDLVVSNDTQPNFLYINRGNGTFEEKAIIAGIGYDESGRARAGMGVDVADINNDGDLSIVIGNFSQEPLSLYSQLGGAVMFQDLAGKARLTRASLLPLTFGVLFSDLDLDGAVDLAAANGHIEPEINVVQQNITFAQTPQVFYNQEGAFSDVSEKIGGAFSEPVVGRTFVQADIDKDGDPDLLLTVNGGPPKLLRNDSKHENGIIRIKLKGRAPNLQAIGAEVVVKAGTKTWKRTVRTGSSYLGQSYNNEIIFGTGGRKVADSVIVFWPVYGETNLKEVPADGHLQIIEQ